MFHYNFIQQCVPKCLKQCHNIENGIFYPASQYYICISFKICSIYVCLVCLKDMDIGCFNKKEPTCLLWGRQKFVSGMKLLSIK